MGAKPDSTVDNKTVREVVIIGSGPAGLAAALYTARAQLNPLVITGIQLGGQISTTTEVENYPGFTGETGPDLVDVIQAQAEHFGTEIQFDYIESVDFSQYPFKLSSQATDYYAKAVVVATGAAYRKLDIPGEAALSGRGVSYCATCDGFFFKEKKVMVIGGGDSAMEEAIYLTRFADKVTVVHRRDKLRAGATLQERAFKNPKIEFVWNTIATRINGEERAETVDLKNVATGATSTMPVDGVFVAIGQVPNSTLFEGQLAIDDKGYVVVDRMLRTNVEGVWAAGEISDPIFRQAITSAGMGAGAAIEVERWLSEQTDT